MFALLDPRTYYQSFQKLFQRDDPWLKQITNAVDQAKLETRETTAFKIYQTYQDLAGLIADLNPFIDYYLVDLILNTHKDQTLSEDPSSGKMFTIEIDSKAQNASKIQKRIDRLYEVIDLEAVLADVLSDAMFWGQYPLRIMFQKTGTEKGIVDLLDVVQPGSLVSIHRKHLPSIVFEKTGREIRTFNPWEYWTLDMSMRKLMIESQYGWTKIPYHLRVGRPMFANLLPQIRDLMSLEIIDVARELAELSRNSLVNISGPDGLDLDKQKIYTTYYEKKINRKVGDLTTMSPQAIEKIIRKSGEMKAIIRDSSKGEVNPISLSQAHHGENRIDKIKDRREAICTSTGTPFEVVFGQTDVSARGGIRQFARFQKRIAANHKAIGWAIKRLIAIDTAMAGIEIRNWKDIQVNFSNFIDAEELQTLEAIDTKFAMYTTAVQYMNELGDSSVLSPYVKKDKAAEFMQTLMGGMKGAAEILDPANPEEPEGEPGGDFGGPGNFGNQQQQPQDAPAAEPQPAPGPSPEKEPEVTTEPEAKPEPEEEKAKKEPEEKTPKEDEKAKPKKKPKTKPKSK